KSTSTASYLGSSSEPIRTCLQASLLGSAERNLPFFEVLKSAEVFQWGPI
ncbi:hypothetical protein ACJX0J_012231, partial [Zea mays]